MPAAAHLIQQRRAKYVRPSEGHVLCCPQIVALVMTPYGNTRFIGVVENVATVDRVLRREVMVDPGRVVVLVGGGAEGRGQIILRPVGLCRHVGSRLVPEQREWLRTQQRLPTLVSSGTRS